MKDDPDKTTMRLSWETKMMLRNMKLPKETDEDVLLRLLKTKPRA